MVSISYTKNNIYRFYKDIRLLLYYKIICSERFKKKNNKRIKNIEENSNLSITASYFTLYAFQELNKIDTLRFIYSEPTFIKNNNKTVMKKIKENENKIFGVEEELNSTSILNQSHMAGNCQNGLRKRWR